MFKQIALSSMLVSMSAFAASSVYNFSPTAIDGAPTSLATFKGKVAMIVNVASKCGYTPQYAGLESLYRKYKDQGFVILGFPANNFGAQEPGTNDDIKTFCTRTYQVDFPMFSKISVKGGDKDPLYQFLTDTSGNPSTGGEIKWNFTKFLIDRNGKVIARFESKVEPDSTEVTSAIEQALKK